MFKTVTGQNRGEAITIKPKTVVTGYLVGMKAIVKTFGKGKSTEKRTNYIYQFRQTDGSTLEVWGNGALNQVLLDEKRKRLNPTFVGYLVRVTGGKKIQIKGRPLPMQSVEVAVDYEKKLRGK
jgi:hypothetical protein